MTEPRHRAGIIAILGAPNAGKSTLLNRLLGEKLAIVTGKPQTTRSRILGIVSRENAQLVLIDTPGFHQSEKTLNRLLNEQVEEAARDCDAALLLVDLSRGWESKQAELFEALEQRNAPVVLAGTKCDLPTAAATPWPPAGTQHARATPRISALTGAGVETLLDTLVSILPEGPALYPEGEWTDRPVRWLAAELVREAFFEELGRELPYDMAAEVVRYDESRSDLVSIRVNLLVQRNSQKRIVVGQGGEMIKRIGTRARRQIERLVGSRVHLELWVKVEPGWQRRQKRVEALGYQ